MSNNKKSAKDLAFDKERQKFQREIRELNEDIRNLRIDIEKKSSHIEELHLEIQSLNEKINYLTKGNYTPEELDNHINRTKKISDMFSLLNGMY